MLNPLFGTGNNPSADPDLEADLTGDLEVALTGDLEAALTGDLEADLANLS